MPDTLSKLRELVRIARNESFPDATVMADAVLKRTLSDPKSSFRDLNGQLLSAHAVRRTIEFAADLRLITYDDPDDFLPYQPLTLGRKELENRIAIEVWAYFQRNGISRFELEAAIQNVGISDVASIWECLGRRKLPLFRFRQCMHLLSQVSPDLLANRKKTYYVVPR